MARTLGRQLQRLGRVQHLSLRPRLGEDCDRSAVQESPTGGLRGDKDTHSARSGVDACEEAFARGATASATVYPLRRFGWAPSARAHSGHTGFDSSRLFGTCSRSQSAQEASSGLGAGGLAFIVPPPRGPAPYRPEQHRSLGQEAGPRMPLAMGAASPKGPPSPGRIVAEPEVGGLHHRYQRAA